MGTLVLEPQSAEPAIRQVQVHLLAQPPFRADAKAVADQQHPHHEFGVHRGPSSVAVEGCKVLAQIRQVEIPIDAAEQMVRRYVLIKVEGIKQSVLVAAVFSHHAAALPAPLLITKNLKTRHRSIVSQRNRPEAVVRLTQKPCCPAM